MNRVVGMTRRGVSRLYAGMVYMMAAVIFAGLLSGCESVDDDRIPPYEVWVTFDTQADWITYGVPGALDYRMFVKSQRLPANYPYSVGSATGFGGVLLCGNYVGEPVAFDLACPVECRQDVRIIVDSETHRGRCPVCGSTYDIFSGTGAPLSGVAAEQRYGLQVYRVSAGAQGRYRVITR